MFMMNTDSYRFETRDQLESDGWTLAGNTFEHRTPGAVERMLPLYEAKMIHHFDHRWATYEGTGTRDLTATEHDDPDRFALPRYWVRESDVTARLVNRWSAGWLWGYREIARSTDDRTLVTGPIPLSAVGNKYPLLIGGPDVSVLGTALSSIVVDFLARQKIGGTSMSQFIVQQLPAPPPAVFTSRCPWDDSVAYTAWITARALELIYTADDMTPFARDQGDDGPPFRWDVSRRTQLRAELDACFLHLYGLGREDAAYVLDTFPIANRKDPGLIRRVLTAYDALADAARTGEPFQSPLNPPPGRGRRHG